MIKKMTLALIIAALGFTAAQAYLAVSTQKTPQQSYRVVRKEKGVEIRYYPPALMATVTSSANNYRELAYGGFRKLAGYIFGGNETGEKIAMTSPVHMDMEGSQSSMSFVMPEGYTLDKLPRPKNADVHIHETQGEYVAAISFGGFANDGRIERQSEKLKAELDKAGIRIAGPFRYLGYNPPYQLIGRKNDIIVRVEFSE
jgi:hypothetical protein